MIIDEKVLLSFPPPPSYDDDSELPSFAAATTGVRDTPLALSTIPPHLLLHIVYLTIPQGFKLTRSLLEEQRRALYWLSDSLRLVDRALYITCQHLLRSTYLPIYSSLVKQPYTSDPFPFLCHGSSSSPYPRSPLSLTQRETAVLDRFIALKVRQDVYRDESAFHLESPEKFEDLFVVSQPKARLEDLVRVYGVRNGVIRGFNGENAPRQRSDRGRGEERKAQRAESSSRSSRSTIVESPPASPSSPSPTSSRFSTLFRRKKSVLQLASNFSSRNSSTATIVASAPSPTYTQPPPRPRAITPLPFSSLGVTFSPRSVSLSLSTPEGRKRTLVTVPREAGNRRETLEALAKKIVQELRWFLENDY